jgi:GAF domain-containing protein
MFRGEQVIVSDILEDPLWEDYRGLASQFGLRACWSTPIVSHTGNVLGSFAMYYHEPRNPKPEEIHLINVATHVAVTAIERQQRRKTQGQRGTLSPNPAQASGWWTKPAGSLL